MANATASLILESDYVPLRVFESGVTRFSQLLDELSRTLGANRRIDWVLDRLDTSSAITRVRPQAAQSLDAGPVLKGLIDVGRALEARTSIPYGHRVGSKAKELRKILDGGVTTLRLETSEADVTIHRGTGVTPHPANVRAFGAVIGRIQTISSRGGYVFTLYDAVFDKAVTCYLQPGQESWLRDKWDRRAVVEGTISRDGETNRPLNIRHITAIDSLPEYASDSYPPTLSDLPGAATGEDAGEIIQRLRNAW